ncbi:MAG: sigma-54-dependent Fis family transcriptional regulator [Chloroflexi bacterium]|nr:MAG: sigma-54-dependent Fis family transcriptional regulator [Chloroflexota bacterium]MBL1193730.1 sigma-54-dependent Fis family transcriptional regulator [Chloroflexota bacterium]NOH11023.1 sigma-54-dependent Fis family transcriptional regulator [Chloroflexota bacterium]
MSMTILIVDDEKNARKGLSEFLQPQGYEVIEAEKLAEAYEQLDQGNADIVLLDVKLPDGVGTSLLEETAHIPYRPPIIMITAYGEVDMAVKAMNDGAFYFLQKPINLEHLKALIEKASDKVKLFRQLAAIQRNQQQEANFIVGKSTAMQEALELAERAAEASASTLITGETGTGKEVIAQYMYSVGSRKNTIFLPIDCGVIQPTMLETELFGHEAGAFTSADKRKIGLMEAADGGILFLDEISSMPVEVQTKLLRALESQSFRRLGGTKEINVDVQVIAASNKNLPEMIEAGDFREDLYYRLNLMEIQMPSLAERKEDVPDLVGHFVNKFAPKYGKNITDVTPAALEAMTNYTYKGNIRDLRNVIERAVILCDDAAIDLPHLPRDMAVPA